MIYVQENIFVVSFHHFSALVSKLNKVIKQSFRENIIKGVVENIMVWRLLFLTRRYKNTIVLMPRKLYI